MKSEIIHADGRRIDLAGSVDPATYAELEKTRSPRLQPVLTCGGCGGGIYLQHGRVRKDELFGYHHNAGTCAQVLVVRKSAMSDEHKREAEYHARAAERAATSRTSKWSRPAIRGSTSWSTAASASRSSVPRSGRPLRWIARRGRCRPGSRRSRGSPTRPPPRRGPGTFPVTGLSLTSTAGSVCRDPVLSALAVSRLSRRCDAEPAGRVCIAGARAASSSRGWMRGAASMSMTSLPAWPKMPSGRSASARSSDSWPPIA